MVNDILFEIKSNLLIYEHSIIETENMELRQLLIQIRNSDESFQYEVFKIAKLKGYISNTIPANSTEIQDIKNEFE